MRSIEMNNDDWREIRARADSIATVVFFMSGGALSLSITVMLGQHGTYDFAPQLDAAAVHSWYFLLAAVGLFLLLKIYIVFEAFLLQFRTIFMNKHIKLLNSVAWAIGLLGFVTFIAGMSLLVRVAAIAVTL